MRELLKGWRRSQNAFFLTGTLLFCTWHPAVAQNEVSLILEPPNPQVGQDVTLAVRGGPQSFLLCEWFREPPRKGERETILEYIPGQPPQQRNGTAQSGREGVKADCSLRITNLRLSDTGNYSVIFEALSSKQEGGQSLEDYYQGSVYLQVSDSVQNTISVQAVPPSSYEGEEVTLTPQGTPHEIVFCEWLQEESSGKVQSIVQYHPKEQQSPQSSDSGRHERVTVGRDCSLRMTKLTVADSGTYTVKMEVLLDRRQHQPGQGSRPQEPSGIQKYWGQVDLQVNHASNKDQQTAAAAGLRYSAGIIAGALLLFFSGTDTFPSLFHRLCFGRDLPAAPYSHCMVTSAISLRLLPMRKEDWRKLKQAVGAETLKNPQEWLSGIQWRGNMGILNIFCLVFFKPYMMCLKTS